VYAACLCFFKSGQSHFKLKTDVGNKVKKLSVKYRVDSLINADHGMSHSKIQRSAAMQSRTYVLETSFQISFQILDALFKKGNVK